MHQQRRLDAEIHPPGNVGPPPLEHANVAPDGQDVLPPVDEALRTAAQARAEADAQDIRAATEDVARDTVDDDDPHLNALPGLHPNVNARRRRGSGRGDFLGDDDLGASFMADGYPDAPPPWLSQVINAAVTAAATAVAALPQRSAPPSRPSMAPTKLSDRKVPDFWESKPEEWFRILDAHLAFFTPTEEANFNTLLPLLTPAALPKMTPILRVRGRNPYSQAKKTLLKHFCQDSSGPGQGTP